MVSELDGMNKYLQGVKMPQAIGGGDQQSYTLKKLRQDEKQLNYQREEPSGDVQRSNVGQLYGKGGPIMQQSPQFAQPMTGADVPPPRVDPLESSSGVKAKSGSNYDVVDDMYQSIDDFEDKLANLTLHQR